VKTEAVWPSQTLVT